MWFTRVSINNPVMATMVMFAFVVLGLFSYQRLAVDQFPNVDFPTVVIVIDYPGASPEIVESEVTKKVEEAVNTVAGINALWSRSYEGTSVVVQVVLRVRVGDHVEDLRMRRDHVEGFHERLLRHLPVAVDHLGDVRRLPAVLEPPAREVLRQHHIVLLWKKEYQ